MKRITTLALIMLSLTAFAQGGGTSISNNVIVQYNSTAQQCTANWRGTSQPYNVTTDSRFGSQTGTSGSVVQSCTGCSFDSRAKTCTCRVCYGYFN